ncbi:MAG: tetratricopeptide repeat protein [Bacteroidetes bacterium]|nr:tetratricopeptide repeat protein [Bacteroidota bacterium]
MKINTVITYFIFSVWGGLLIMGGLTLISPDWLVELSHPGKNVEAISIKNAGNTYLKSNKYNEAIQQYTKALKIVPDLKSAIANLAIAYQKTGDYNKAIISFDHLLTLEPEYPGVIYYNLGEIYEKIGQPKKALESYLVATHTSAFPEKAYQKAGHIYMNQKEWDIAIINFKLAIENRLTIENSYKGMLLTYQKAYADTTKKYQEIDDILKTQSYLSRLSEYDESIINKQLYREVNLAKTYNNIGYCLAMQVKYKEAKDYLIIALKIYPSYTEAKNNLKIVESQLAE